MKTIQLVRFKRLVAQLAEEIKSEFPDLYFDYAGIIPEEKDSRYDSSPINTCVFARTGGDGVHFSILELSDKIQPVIMTVPMAFGRSVKDYNVIVGENLNEFLSVGYYNGWFFLEDLCYHKQEAIEFYSKENMDFEFQSDGDIQFLKKLRNTFNYSHIPITEKRLNELEMLYFNELKFNQEFIEKYIK